MCLFLYSGNLATSARGREFFPLQDNELGRLGEDELETDSSDGEVGCSFTMVPVPIFLPF